MTEHDQDQGRQAGPPGRPLWLAAERARRSQGVGKFDWVKKLGIGRRSYDRLEFQENPPITRTVKKIADVIGMDIDDAMDLVGYQTTAAPDSGADLVVQGPGGVVLVQVKRFRRSEAERQLDLLREAGEEAGRTLGDVLVLTGLAEPDELKIARNDQAAGEIANDLPDDVKQRIPDRSGSA